MDGAPPPFAQYPRNTAPAYGSAGQLKSLMDGYYSYGWLFLVHVILSLAVLGFAFAAPKIGGPLYYPLQILVMFAMGGISYPANSKVGFGANWSKTQVILACALIGISTFCCGVVAYIILQTVAANNIKKFGVKSGFFGLKKKDIRARIAELEAAGQ